MSNEERTQIANALEEWVNLNYNGALASIRCHVNYFSLNKWINQHYLQKKQTEETVTLTIPSKV